MNWTMLLIGILPLVIFVIVEWRGGAEKGIWAAIGLAVVFAIFSIFVYGELDSLTVLETVFIVGLGILSLKLKSSKLFKFQPAVVAACLAALIAYYQFFAVPILVRMVPLVKAMQPELAQVFDNPQTLALLSSISSQLIGLFLVHGLIMAWTAWKSTNLTWLLWRLAIYPMMFGLFIVNSGLHRAGG